MRIVAAVGGNALLRRGQRADDAVQRRNLHGAVAALADAVGGEELVVVHGNGPQVGLLARESAADPALRRPYPLDSLVAETQGMIGYWLAAELGAALPDREVAALVTRVVVRRSDPAFALPTKFIGPGYSLADSRALEQQRGWRFLRDGRRWRRVVASPDPVRIVEQSIVERLLESGAVVVAAGGGGIPVVGDPGSEPGAVEAVVDKDLSAALLARELKADALLLLTDVAAVQRGFGTRQAEPVAEATVAELVALGLPEGSMAPKVEAARRFLASGGAVAAIGALEQAGEVLAGTAGTRVRM
ncbi:carbamate kinase [Saccharomonospora amisosensis]|uniref:Carbamate kinase n=1 Tax=Saccharomonospora amisosensis TaxID=1128677 RepID=A0A7X5UNN0_9PSEU|nr:carbamate kinase [Saccharomonospora amisosensis]NIJ11358.1 carbamate kinase [Saccharomonospora amisosensis]